MSISSETRVAGPYSGNGVTTVFAFAFKVFTAADLQVVQTNASGVDTTLALTTNYTVALNANQDASPGGSVTCLVAPPTGYKITITSAVGNLQSLTLTNNGGFLPNVINDALDRLTILVQQIIRDVSRSIKIPLSDGTLTTQLGTATQRLGAALVFDAVTGAPALSVNIGAQATAAAASAAAAAASAAAASATLASALWRDVVFKTFADSPITIAQADNGKLYRIDTSGGSVVINLPTIAGLTMPFALGIKKESSDGNTVTINRGGTDTIDGGTSKTINVPNSATTLIADTDPAPDQWTAADAISSSGNMTSDTFNGTGAQTAFTLSVTPGSVANVAVFVSGVRQRPTLDYTVSGTTLTFGSAPASGTNNILAVSGTTLAIGTPADGTVTAAKLAASAVGVAAMTSGAATNGQVATANGSGGVAYVTPSGGPTLLATNTPNGAASTSFSSALITSTYSSYEIRFSGLFAPSGTNIYLRTSTANGSPYLTASYYWGSSKVTGGAVISQDGSTSDTKINVSAGGGWGAIGTAGAGIVRVFNPSASGQICQILWNSQGGNGAYFGINGGGANPTTSPTNNIQLIADSGNITGTVELWGIP